MKKQAKPPSGKITFAGAPGKSLRPVSKGSLIAEQLGPYDFICEGCSRVHAKSAYCIAQATMGHTVIFTCTCGFKTELCQ